MNHAEIRRPEAIQAEIEQTREEMDLTLRQIEQRLNPRELMNQGVDYLRHSGGKEFVTNLRGSVKDNPMPVTLVGIGLAWLMAASKSPGRSAQSGLSTDKLGGKMDAASQKLEGASQKLHGTAHAASQKLSSTAQAARERVSRLGESARGLGESARHRAQQARGGYERIVQEQPLALGALGLAIGAMLAASVPRTRKEDELMGPAKERLAERAKERIDEMKPEATHQGDETPRPKITVGIVETGPL